MNTKNNLLTQDIKMTDIVCTTENKNMREFNFTGYFCDIVINKYMSIWCDVPYISMEFPDGISWIDFRYCIGDIDRTFGPRPFSDSIYTHYIENLIPKLDEFDRMNKNVIFHKKKNAKMCYDILIEKLNPDEKDEIESNKNDSIKIQLQRVMNILFKDYYKLRRFFDVCVLEHNSKTQS